MTEPVKFVALTSANQVAMHTVTEHLAHLITKRDARVVILQGVRTAAEAHAVYMEGGEIWRIGEDASAPELDQLVDREIDDTSQDTLIAGTQEALDAMLRKVRVAA